MWVLEGLEKEAGKIHYLTCGTPLLVSRRDGHIVLQGDNSVSRQHAYITITNDAGKIKNQKSLPEVSIRDCTAKYGTFINTGIDKDKKMEGTRCLKDGDVIRFGILANKWRLKFRPLLVTSSALQAEGKKELETALVKLGGHLIGEWCSSCAYLVMDNITLTIKVVSALAAAIPIVTPKFLTQWVESIERKKDPPVAAKFLPPLQEMTINQSLASFAPNEHRSQVLSGRTFIFPSAKQMRKLGQAVNLAGGNAVLLCEENYDIVSSTSYLLIQLPPEKNQEPQRTKCFKLALEILKSNGLRVIPESDIGLAILYMNTDKHCNSSFHVSDILKRNESSVPTSEGMIYATETQDSAANLESLTGTRIVPESLTTPSRRTPAIMPPPSFPLSNSANPSATDGSSASTYVSVLSAPSSAASVKHDPEDKENIMKGSSKRLRALSNGGAEPPPKRSNVSASACPPTVELEPTQPIEDEGDEDELPDAIPEGDATNVSKFEPKHFSTLKNKITPSKSVKDSKEGETKSVSATCTSDVSVNVDESNRSLEPTVGRSIPFEPYTLPSLNAEQYKEDAVETQPFDGIKQEPLSLPMDEPEHYNEKRPREDTYSSDDESASGWLGKKRNKVDNTINMPVKQERSSFSNKELEPPVIKKELQSNNEDLFALPSTSGRSRRRAEAKRKTVNEEVAAKDGEEDFFSLPTTSRAEQRRRKMMKTEDVASTSVEAKGTVNEAAIPGHTDQHIPATSRIEGIKVSNGSWISKTGEEGDAAITSPVKAEAASSTSYVSAKSEPRHGDVAELSGAFERSLIVIEVASLVKRREKKPPLTSSAQTMSCGNLKNYKRFKKVASDVTSLPKIIGGRDLVPHDVADISRRDEWFRDNAEILEERETRHQEDDRELDNMFNLPARAVNRRRR